MNYKTRRVIEYDVSKALPTKNEKRKKALEYYTLAVLKCFYPEKLQNARIKEEPDIQCESVGIEVTLAESVESMKSNSAFIAYENGIKPELNKRVIENNGNKLIEKDINGKVIPVLFSEGVGTDDDNYVKRNIMEAIDRKNKRAVSYKKNTDRDLDLAILFKEPIPSSFKKKIIDYIKEAPDELLTYYNTIYVIGNDFLFSINLGLKDYKKYTIDKEMHLGLDKIARMTVEEILTLDSEEWN